jgi:hypothetical protein
VLASAAQQHLHLVVTKHLQRRHAEHLRQHKNSSMDRYQQLLASLVTHLRCGTEQLQADMQDAYVGNSGCWHRLAQPGKPHSVMLCA